MNESPSPLSDGDRLDGELHMLNSGLVRRIDQALCRLGDFGEVRLVVAKGRLRFIQTVRSENVAGPHSHEEVS